MSIEENLALAATRGERRGLASALGPQRREHFRERIAELNLGLENRMGDRMDLLSGGQRQAVSLVMATLAGSEVLLLDEHTAALDPGMAEFVMNLTQKIVSGAQADDADGYPLDAPGARLWPPHHHAAWRRDRARRRPATAARGLQVEDLIAMFRQDPRPDAR